MSTTQFDNLRAPPLVGWTTAPASRHLLDGRARGTPIASVSPRSTQTRDSGSTE
jgi:hypothetical protein